MNRSLPDPFTLAIWLGLLGAGLIAVASASTAVAANQFDGQVHHHLVRHGVYVVLAGCAFVVVLAVPTSVWQKLAPLAFVATVVLLALVMVPWLGHEANGSRRWLRFGGISVQPVELGKFLLVVHMAAYVVRHREHIARSLVGLLAPLVLLGIPSLLLLAQPDLGSVVIIVLMATALLFLAGARVSHLVLLGTLVGAVLVALIQLQPYRMQRFQAFLDPWHEDVRLAGGYQLTQALIAFGRGEWFGVGLGEGLQKLLYLPEAHTDFIFAVIAEETGVVGAVAIIAALAVLVLRGLMHGRRAEERGDAYAGALAYGAALMLGIQALVSLGVNTGLLPTKGLTLPLISYGGNSLIVSSALVALLVRVDWENREPAPPRRAGGCR